MIDLILEQEFYAQRYRILRNLENLEHYREREAEFTQIAEQIANRSDQRELIIDRIVQLHIQYTPSLGGYGRCSWVCQYAGNHCAAGECAVHFRAPA